MWPDLETRVDLVNYRGIARTIARLIEEPHMTPLTIGIHGEWGSGKSSVMGMVADELPDGQFLKVSFNGWAFEGFEDAKLALMETLVDELAKNKTVLANVTDRLVDLAKRVNYLKVLKKSASFALTMHGVPMDVDSLLRTIRDAGSTSADALKTGATMTVKTEHEDPWLRAATNDTPEHIHGFRKQLEELIDKAKAGRLVVFIDDLDRCLPETAIETLEAIKLFLSVKGTTFVIAADDAFIQYAVGKHFPGIPASSGPGTVSSNYLEKLIQIPFKLPRLNRAESRRYVSLLLIQNVLRAQPAIFDALLSAVETTAVLPWETVDLRAIVAREEFGAHEAQLVQQLNLASQISAPLDDIANGNPRQIKRFLNTLTLRRRIADTFGLHEVVQDAVLAKLMLLERFAPNAYGAIISVATTRPDGKVPFIADLEASDLDAEGAFALRRQGVPEEFGGDSERESWLLSWVRSSKKLGELDLRPYLFVSRENPTEFVVGATLDAALFGLATQLMEAEAFAAGALQPQLQALNVAERTNLARIMWDAVQAAGQLDHKPTQVGNLHLVTDGVADAQAVILTAMEKVPLALVRPWMPAFVKRVAKSSEHARRFGALMARWRKSPDPNVVAAVQFVSGV